MIALMLIGGASLLYLGAEALIRGACRFAISLGVSSLVIGLTIISMGTSLPEAVTSFVAQVQDGKGDISLANVIGSNIANMGLILGLTALIHPLSFSKHVCKIDMPIMISTNILLFFIMLTLTINRISGVFFLLCLIFYILFRFKTTDLTDDEKHLLKFESTNRSKIFEYGLDLILIIIGIGFLVLGGNYFVNGAVLMAEALNISDRVIGLTVVAVGTSLPELITTLLAAYRKHSDIAIGNIVGSNIFNTLFIVGSVASFRPIFFSKNLLYFDAPIMLGFCLLLWQMMQKQYQISRLQGLILLFAYSVYIFYSILS